MGAGEGEFSLENELKQLFIVIVIEGRISTKPEIIVFIRRLHDVYDDSDTPDIDFFIISASFDNFRS